MNNKKITILFILVATISLLGIVGFTIAYFTSSTDFENEFNTALYQTEATETFTSPQNWMPGDETPKTLTITNTGNVDVAARVCISEEWTSSNDDELPLIQNGERMAIINLDNISDWTKNGNCYEYNDVLEPNDTTSSFIESVTFNPNAKTDIECTTTTNNGSTTKTCESTGDGYDNATYKLTLRVETVQVNKAGELWIPVLQYGFRLIPGEITTGDEISIAGEPFYVVSSDSANTVLLAKYNLLVGDELMYNVDREAYLPIKTLSSSDTGYGLQSSSAKGYTPNDTHLMGGVAFSGTNYWDNSACEYISSGMNCAGPGGLLPEYSQNGETYYSDPHNTNYPYVYRSNMGNMVAPNIIVYNRYGYAQNNGYTIAYYVENYVNKLKELGSPNTITGRLLTYEEIIDLGCSEEDNWCSNVGSNNNPTNGTAPSWVYSSSYWLGSAYDDQSVSGVSSTRKISYDNSFRNTFYGVRPVIEIPTSELN